MPSSIPYNHPSLVLGNVADTGVLDLCSQIQQCNNQIEIAQDTSKLVDYYEKESVHDIE